MQLSPDIICSGEQFQMQFGWLQSCTWENCSTTHGSLIPAEARGFHCMTYQLFSYCITSCHNIMNEIISKNSNPIAHSFHVIASLESRLSIKLEAYTCFRFQIMLQIGNNFEDSIANVTLHMQKTQIEGKETS